MLTEEENLLYYFHQSRETMSLKAILKRALPNPVKRASALMLRGWTVPPKKLQNFLAFTGSFDFMVEGKPVKMIFTKRWIENDLFWHGLDVYEPVSIKLWVGLSRNAKTILDIGANTGLFSLVAKSVNPSAVIWSFEPLPQFAAVLRENCRLNRYDVNVAQVALSNFEGEASFFSPEENEGNVYSSTLKMDHYLLHQESNPTEYKVNVTSADSFLEKQDIHTVDLIKIDAEGADVEVIEGLSKILDSSHPDVLVEVHSDEIADRVSALLSDRDYLYFLIDEDKGLIQVDKLCRGPGFNVMACSKKRTGSVEIARRMSTLSAKS